MKKIIMLLLFVPFIGLSQVCDSIKITKTDFTPVVVELKGKSSSEIYSKIKSWINRTYKNPDLVTKADEKDTYIRIHSIDAFEFRQMGLARNNYSYDLEFQIKENKYKIIFFNIIDTSIINASFPKYFYKDNGDLYGFKKVNLSMQKGIINSLNNIHFSVFNYINNSNDTW